MSSDPFAQPPKWPAPGGPTGPRLEPKRSGRRGATVAAVILFSVGGVALVGAMDGGKDGPDRSAQTACRHFRNVAADYSDGVLTLDELRSKLREVDRDASASSERGIAVNARAMLAGITTGTDDELGSAVRLFGSSCSALGL